MVSRIIELENERQHKFLNPGICTQCGTTMVRHQTQRAVHKQSLINLKKHLDEEVLFILSSVYYDDEPCDFDHHGYCQNHHTCGDDKCSNIIVKGRLKLLITDIEELNKMIERYN